MNLTSEVNHLLERFAAQYFYGEAVGVYLIKLPDQLLLFDLPSYSSPLEAYLTSFNKPISCLLSHGSCGIADGYIWQQKINLQIYLHQADQTSEWLQIKPDVLFTAPPKFADNLEIVFTPGHTPGSVCLYESTTKTLFTGDTFGGLANGEINDFLDGAGFNGDLNQRFHSCQKLLKYDFENVLPFHYQMILGNANSSFKKFLSKHYQ